MTTSPVPAEKPSTHMTARLSSLFYDLWPMVALWMLLSFVFVSVYGMTGHGARATLPPFSPLQWLLWLCCWMLTGAYAVLSWRRGGQTLAMRAWRLRLVDAAGGVPSWRQLCVRYAVGTLSLALGGLGFWWAWVDRERLTWHDRASDTRLIRLPKRNP
jgi:uncharacterized RDD family membrane protein YckC